MRWYFYLYVLIYSLSSQASIHPQIALPTSPSMSCKMSLPWHPSFSPPALPSGTVQLPKQTAWLITRPTQHTPIISSVLHPATVKLIEQSSEQTAALGVTAAKQVDRDGLGWTGWRVTDGWVQAERDWRWLGKPHIFGATWTHSSPSVSLPATIVQTCSAASAFVSSTMKNLTWALWDSRCWAESVLCECGDIIEMPFIAESSVWCVKCHLSAFWLIFISFSVLDFK